MAFAERRFVAAIARDDRPGTATRSRDACAPRAHHPGCGATSNAKSPTVTSSGMRPLANAPSS